MFDRALLIANSETELAVIATAVLSTTSPTETRKEPWFSTEARCLAALMEHEKNSKDEKPSFRNILHLLENKSALEPVLDSVWSNDDQTFRAAVLRSLAMRLMCEYEGYGADTQCIVDLSGS